MKVNICGQEYTIFYETEDEPPKFNACECTGYMEPYAKEIHILHNEKTKRTVKDIYEFEHKVLRHELIHALLFECGATEYWDNESIVDMLAILYPKLEKIISEATALFETEQKAVYCKEHPLRLL